MNSVRIPAFFCTFLYAVSTHATIDDLKQCAPRRML
jgi:hypothetical protein